MDYDLKSGIQVGVALNIGSISSDTTTQGVILDSESVDLRTFKSAVFTLVTGTITDGDYALKLEYGEESDLSDAVDVPEVELIGSLPTFTADTDDNKALSVGYVGKKRYFRASVVSTNTSTGGVVGVLIVKGNPSYQPVGA